MAMLNAKQRVVDFLEQQLFQPVLDQNPDRYPPFRRAEIEEVQSSVAREREGIRAAISAEAAFRGFREATRRSAATGLEEKLRALELPTFESIASEFEKLAAELGGEATGRAPPT